MASTENSGLQQDFETGATRSADDHKIDFEGHLSPEALHYFAEYMHRNRVQRDGKVRASDNWQLGIPAHKYVKSLLRHTFDLWRAWRGTITYNPDNGKVQPMADLLAAIIFNAQGLLDLWVRNNVTDFTHLPERYRLQIEKNGEFRPKEPPPRDMMQLCPNGESVCIYDGPEHYQSCRTDCTL